MSKHNLGDGLVVELPDALTFGQFLAIDTELFKYFRSVDQMKGASGTIAVMLSAGEKAGLIGKGWDAMPARAATVLANAISALYSTVSADPKA